MAHGTPLAIKGAEDALGEAGPFMLDVGIASSYHIAGFWGLTQHSRGDEKPAKSEASVIALPSTTKDEFVRASRSRLRRRLRRQAPRNPAA